jgi:predicted Zn-dependent peptidase
VIPLEEITSKVEAITLDDIHQTAEELFGHGEYAMAKVGPFEGE